MENRLRTTFNEDAGNYQAARPGYPGALYEDIFRYAENNISAGVAYRGDYKTVVLGFPIETLETQEQIDCLIGEIARFFR